MTDKIYVRKRGMEVKRRIPRSGNRRRKGRNNRMREIRKVWERKGKEGKGRKRKEKDITQSSNLIAK